MIAAENARIAIYGAGAMGTVLGALLTNGGLKNVDLINRNITHVESLRTNGVQIECAAEGKTMTARVNACFPADMTGQYDVIFLMTKQRYNAEIVTGLLPYLKEDGIVCTTQNGLPEQSVANVIGKERTYGAVMSYGAGFIGNGGRVKMTSKISAMNVQVGGYENDGGKLPLLQEILSYAAKVTNGKFVSATEDLTGARWSKLAINAAFSGLSVVTGLSFGEIAKKRKTRRLALGIIKECIGVAQGLGVKMAPMQGHDMEKLLGGKLAYHILPFAMRKHKKLLSGMLRDVQNGRKCEIDFINGVVASEGKRVGVDTPLCEKVVELVHGIENGLYEISYDNTAFFGL